MNLLVLFIFAIFCVKSALMHSTGAPNEESCDMIPRHPFQKQEGDAEIEIVIPSWIVSNSIIPITIRSTNVNFSFRGFKVQARTMQGEIIGRFIPNGGMGVGVVTCFGISNSGATHTTSILKSEVLIEWQAPNVEASLLFNIFVTTVQSVDMFWVDQRSALHAVIPESLQTTDITTEMTTEQTTEMTTEETTEKDSSEIDAIYQGCGERKVCFGIPNHCFIDEGNCQSFGAITYENDEFIFEIFSTTNQRYVAMGISKTQHMSDSSIIECVQEDNGIIYAYASWSVGRTVSRTLVDQNTIELIESRFIEGRLYCKVKKIPRVTINAITLDLINEKFYLLLASGTTIISNQAITQHDTNREVSNGRFLLTDPRNVEIDNTVRPLLLIHGSFMIVAWIGLTSIGIVMARYFKSLWRDKKACGMDVWFMWHMLCMFLTLALTLAGFILIFIDVGGWHTSTHAVLGCVVFSLTCLQSISAIFRPDPKAKNRPLFNWLHRAFGNITHLIAITTMFFAVGLPRASLPNFTIYILAAFVAFYLLMNVIFTSIDICGLMKKKKRLGVATSKDAPYQLLQKTLYGFFVIAIMLFVIALILIFTLDFST